MDINKRVVAMLQNANLGDEKIGEIMKMIDPVIHSSASIDVKVELISTIIERICSDVDLGAIATAIRKKNDSGVNEDVAKTLRLLRDLDLTIEKEVEMLRSILAYAIPEDMNARQGIFEGIARSISDEDAAKIEKLMPKK